MSWPILARFSTLGEAESSRSALEAAGIDVLAADEHIIGVNWLYCNAVGGVKLSVSEENHAESTVILGSAAEEPSSLEDDLPERAFDDSAAANATALPEANAQASEAVVQDQTIRCPDCGSTAVTRIPRVRFLLFFALVFCAVGYAVDQRDLAFAGVLVAALTTAIAPSHRCTACGERWTVSPPLEILPEPPPPDPSDTVEEPCPRCGSAEFHHIDYRRMKAIPLLVSFTIIVVLLAWPFLAKRQCDECGFRPKFPLGRG